MLAAHDVDTINSHKAPKKLGKHVDRVRCDRYVTSLDGLRIHAHPPEEVGAFGERRPAKYKGQATEPVRTRSCRVVTSEAGGRFAHHTSPRVPVRRAATSGDRGALGDDVSRR